MESKKVNLKKSIKLGVILVCISITGCKAYEQSQTSQDSRKVETESNKTEQQRKEVQESDGGNDMIIPTDEVRELESGLWTVQHTGDYGFQEFLDQGGASSDQEVIRFLSENQFSQLSGMKYSESTFGCSTISVKGSEGDFWFGRNFDWEHSNAWIVLSKPENGYHSISTVNMDFIGAGGIHTGEFPQKALVTAALYAPLDGMNDQGLCVSVNMIQDSAKIDQNTSKPDLTTTTAIRLLLNQAANVEEALSLLEQYDIHGSMGMMVHFALADTQGRSVVVEYIDQEMVVMDTPAVTNFYLTSGKKNGVGTAQSHTRYEILMEWLENQSLVNMEAVRDVLDSVSKDNFGEFESTEWSIVFNQNRGEAYYYHRENYEQAYLFSIR